MMNEELRDKQLDLTGPGRKLLEARVAQNLTREEVAQQLRLKLNTIVAIEEDRIEELPAPMYVVGYLRNYARLLKIPPEPVVEAFEQLRVEAPPMIADVARPSTSGKGARLVKWGSIIIAVVMLAGFVSWLLKQDLDFSGKPATTTVVEQAEDTPGMVVEQQQAPQLENSQVDEPAATEAPQVSEPPVAEPSGENEKVPATGNSATKTVSLTLQGDCWVEVIDSSGKKVIYDLLKSGGPYTYNVSTPFRVFLGNAAAVSMSIDNKPYDLSPHIHGKLARFTITGNEGA